MLGETKFASPRLNSREPSATPPEEIQEEDQSKPPTFTAKMLGGIGTVLIGISLAFYIWYYRIRGKHISSKESKIETRKQDE